MGTIPKLTHTTLPLSLQAYLWLTIFRGSPVLRTRPDKEKERRDEGVDRPSGGQRRACYQKGGVRAGGKKRRCVWTAACRAKALTVNAFSDCGVDALERFETDGRRTKQTYLFSKTMVSESSWTSLT